MALTTSESITLMVKGTCASEFRTRFWPRRFTYSVTTGSLNILDCDSTCMEKDLPMAICFSMLYQLPMPRLQPTLRLPMASTSSIPPSCLTLSGSAACTAGGSEAWSPCAALAPSLPAGALDLGSDFEGSIFGVSGVGASCGAACPEGLPGRAPGLEPL